MTTSTPSTERQCCDHCGRPMRQDDRQLDGIIIWVCDHCNQRFIKKAA